MYLLDTNIFIDMLRNPESRAIKHLKRQRIGNVGISAVTLAELEYGVHKSSNPALNARLLIEACSPLQIMPFDNEAAGMYGTIRAALERKGTPIGPLDTLIAAHAISLNATLVTNNTKEFKRIKDLALVNWINS